LLLTRPVGLEPTASGFGDLRSTTELRAPIKEKIPTIMITREKILKGKLENNIQIYSTDINKENI